MPGQADASGGEADGGSEPDSDGEPCSPHRRSEQGV